MKNNNVSIYLLFMDLLVAFKNDPAGHNMAKFISQKMNKDGDVYRGDNFDLVELLTLQLFLQIGWTKNMIMMVLYFYQNMRQNLENSL